ncbi:MAG: signal recognition particle receptor subunit alpha, partial [Candidatus Aenigmarchaeota archaeon]|nr:signal recognition particle receptor subunit alpha [Candidatus Aenigmarchaeota archaeon]
MFGLLKKHLKDSIDKLAKRLTERKEPEQEKPAPEKAKKVATKPAAEPAKKPAKPRNIKTPEPKAMPEPGPVQEEMKAITAEQKIPEPLAEQPAEPKGFMQRLRSSIIKPIAERKITEADVDSFFAEMEMEMLQDNIALEVVELMRSSLRQSLLGQEASRLKVKDAIQKAFYNGMHAAVDQGSIDLGKAIEQAKQQGRPALFVFLGFNGSGKTTSIAKVAAYLGGNGYKVVLAAGDTFRAAAQEQLSIHAERLGVKIIRAQYGGDSAAVIFDAVKFAQANGYDVVLADTAGRMHTNKNLMDELKKVIRVNRPDLKVLVIDSLTGNDVAIQCVQFNDSVGVDAL